MDTDLFGDKSSIYQKEHHSTEGEQVAFGRWLGEQEERGKKGESLIFKVLDEKSSSSISMNVFYKKVSRVINGTS